MVYFEVVQLYENSVDLPVVSVKTVYTISLQTLNKRSRDASLSCMRRDVMRGELSGNS